MKLIVDGYVKLRGRKALEDLKAHRHRLANELKSLNSVLDLSSTIKQLEEEIAVIDAGLAGGGSVSRAYSSLSSRLKSLCTH